MTKFRIELPEGTRFIEAEKAIHKGNQIIFYEKDGRGIVAQISDKITFFKDSEV